MAHHNHHHAAGWKTANSKQGGDAILKAGLPKAIITRNCREASDIKRIKNNITITNILTWECASAKTEPTALLMID
tara:strand:+ start:5927 stop:6154 length:228 start_codon:yes stop_codon:yes gene_type:complete